MPRAGGARGAKNCDSGAGPGFRGARALSSPFSGIPGQNARAVGDPSVSGEPGRAASSSPLSSVRSTGASLVRWRFAAGAASCCVGRLRAFCRFCRARAVGSSSSDDDASSSGAAELPVPRTMRADGAASSTSTSMAALGDAMKP